MNEPSSTTSCSADAMISLPPVEVHLVLWLQWRVADFPRYSIFVANTYQMKNVKHLLSSTIIVFLLFKLHCLVNVFFSFKYLCNKIKYALYCKKFIWCFFILNLNLILTSRISQPSETTCSDRISSSYFNVFKCFLFT